MAKISAGSKDTIRPPRQIKLLSILILISGIINLLLSSAFNTIYRPSFGSGAALFIPIFIFFFILGICEIVYATKLGLGSVAVEKPSRSLAVMEIHAILGLNIFAVLVGILALVFYHNKTVKAYFDLANIGPQAGKGPMQKPRKVSVVGIMTLISGILNVLLGIAFLFLGMTFLNWLPWMVGPVLGIPLLTLGMFELVYASKLLPDPIRNVKASRSLAVLQIHAILGLNIISLVTGILALVFYKDSLVRDYFQLKTTIKIIKERK